MVLYLLSLLYLLHKPVFSDYFAIIFVILTDFCIFFCNFSANLKVQVMFTYFSQSYHQGTPQIQGFLGTQMFNPTILFIAEIINPDRIFFFIHDF